MQRGESIISLALAACVLLAVVAVQRKWNPADLKDVASSAEQFILTTAGMGGQVPELTGYDRIKVFRLGNYRAGLYRASNSSLIFAPGRFVIYNSKDEPVFQLETLEGPGEGWSALYDFNGRHGVTPAGGRGRPVYLRALAGGSVPNIIVGQYSGGSHCCTVATILALGKDTVTPLGRIDGIDGLPFEGLEVRRITKAPEWQCIAHRPYLTSCGSHFDAADVLTIYAFNGSRFQDETTGYTDYLQQILHQDLDRWKDEKKRTISLLQTVATDDAMVGQRDAGKSFFASNMIEIMPVLQSNHVDVNACVESLDALVDRLPPQPAQ